MKNVITIYCCLLFVFFGSSYNTIAQPKNISQAEFFWGADPGAGNGTPLNAVDGNFDNALETIIANTTSFPAIGANKLSIRLRDAQNNWGAAFSTIIDILPSGASSLREIKITAAEYFWNNDPGQGNGTPMLAFDGNFNDAFEKVTANTNSFPSTGAHKFSIRLRDGQNQWGAVFSTIIDILPSGPSSLREIKITAAEYFWDNDPGQGNGTAMLAFDGNFNDAFEKVITNTTNLPSIGAHKFSIRLRDGQNQWGPVFSTAIDVLSLTTASIRPIRITVAEYFWDNDPGQGNGTAMLAFDGNFNDAFEKVTGSTSNLPQTGVHTLNIRVRDGQNQWSPVFTTIVEVLSATAASIRPMRVSLAEYFFNTDPGVGNATPMLAFDGNFNASLEKIVGASIPAPVMAGVNVLSIRTKDGGNNWGPMFSVVVNIDTTIGGFNTSITGATQLCDNERNNVQYNAPSRAGNTYTWTITGGTIVSGAGTSQIVVNWNANGPYSLSVNECNPQTSFCDDATVTIVVNAVVATTINQTICAGQSFAGYTATGNYVNVFTAANGCDSTRTLNLTVTPAITQTVNQAICNGQSFAGYTSTGTYIDNFTTASGCDSIRTLNLTVAPAITQTVNQTICSGQSFAGYASTGNYVDNFTASSGCDSIRTLNLTVLPPDTSRITMGICQGQSFAGYTQTGVYTNAFTTSSGCDSVRVLTLTVSADIQITINETICNGESFAGYTTAGTYVDLFVATGGCDSTRTLNLVVLEPDTITIDTTICFGANVAGYTTNGIYTDVYTRSGACDSVRILILEVVSSSVSTNNVSICEGDSVFAAGNWQFTAGVYADTASSTSGCFEILLTDVVLLQSPDTPVITQNGSVLSVPPVYSSYQWFLNGAFIPGASGSSIAVVSSGNYTIRVTNANGCTTFSESFNVIISSVVAAENKLNVVAYPNPSDAKVWLLMNGIAEADATLINPLGQTINVFSIYNAMPYELDFSALASGVYLIKIQAEETVILKKITISK